MLYVKTRPSVRISALKYGAAAFAAACHLGSGGGPPSANLPSAFFFSHSNKPLPSFSSRAASASAAFFAAAAPSHTAASHHARACRYSLSTCSRIASTLLSHQSVCGSSAASALNSASHSFADASICATMSAEDFLDAPRALAAWITSPFVLTSSSGGPATAPATSASASSTRSIMFLFFFFMTLPLRSLMIAVLLYAKNSLTNISHLVDSKKREASHERGQSIPNAVSHNRV